MHQKSRKTVFVAFNGSQVLDITGPFQVFAGANEVQGGTIYDLTLASTDGTAVDTSCGLRIDTVPLEKVALEDIDMLVVVGGEEPFVHRAATNDETIAWLKAAGAGAQRIISVCTGTFLLAAAGLVTNERVATHWRAAKKLQELYPALKVDGDAIYVESNRIWTSAGVTTGIDMALAIVEQDLGRDTAMTIARHLVVYAHRPGNQAQFSSLLEGQTRALGSLGRTLDWMNRNLEKAIKVSDAASEAGMSERSFHRKFVAETGETPARYLEKLRLEEARALIENSDLPLKTIAGQSGFRTPVRLIHSFERAFGLSPTAYRRMHGQR